MKKKTIALVAVVLVALCAGAVFLYYNTVYKATYMTMNDKTYRRDITQLSLTDGQLPDFAELAQLQDLQTLDVRGTGLTQAQYEELTQLLPGCRILWDIPFQGAYLSQDTKELTITTLAEADFDALKYLPDLQTIHAEECRELELLMKLQQQYPDCQIAYRVDISGQTVDSTATELELNNADGVDVLQKLQYLPQMQKITFSVGAPDNETIAKMKEAYPDVEFLWDFEIFGIPVNSNTTELDLSGIVMESVEEIENSLKYFNCLERVIMCDCGIPSEEMDALWKRHPETRFIWNVKVGNIKLRTDTTTLMPYKYGYVYQGRSTRLYDKDCKEMKYLVDMVCMDFGHQWVNDISFAQYMPNLEYLLMCENGVRDLTPLTGLKKLKYLEMFSNPITDVSALATCPALEDVNLSYVRIEDITPLLELQNVKNLWLADSYYTEEQKQQIRDAHPDANIVFHMLRSTGSGWRELPNYYKQRDLLGMFYMVTTKYDPNKK